MSTFCECLVLFMRVRSAVCRTYAICVLNFIEFSVNYFEDEEKNVGHDMICWCVFDELYT